MPHERDSGLRKIFAKYVLLKGYPKNALQNMRACIARMSDQLSAENEILLLTIWNAWLPLLVAAFRSLLKRNR